MVRTRGGELKAGQCVKVWWAPGRDTITKLAPYNGPLSYLFKDGAQIAEFAQLKGGMTIDNSDFYEVVT